MFGNEPPEQPHMGQKIVAIIFAIIFLAMGAYGLFNGHIIDSGRYSAGVRYEGTASYFISVSYLCLAALCLMSLRNWRNEKLQKRIGGYLIYAYIVILVVSIFF